MRRPKIVIVGAGGYVFPLRLTVDVLSFPELQDCEIALQDIDATRLRRTEGLVRELVRRNGLPTRVTATTNRRQALDGAGYVIVAFQVGGVEAYKFDVEIPRRYGLDQPVGDTLGPGGVFRGLRSIAVFEGMARDMKAVCPDALVLQYANPMAINCLALHRLGIRTVGLCHSVQGTAWMLANAIGVPYDEVTYTCLGINHQAWYTDFRHKGEDVYPRIRSVLDARFPSPKAARARGKTPFLGGAGDTIAVKEHTGIYWTEFVRTEIMRLTGYFHTESSHHGSEYVPWFRKNSKMIRAYIPKRWDYYKISCSYQSAKARAQARELVEKPMKLSGEYGARIVHAMETNTPCVIWGNVPNWGRPGSDPATTAGHVIPNLSRDCCVEVACLVDRNGVQPTAAGPLPPPCAAITGRCVAVQELAVEGALARSKERIHQAIAMDPLTGALMTLPQIRSMVEDLFRAHRRWLPAYR